MLPVKSEIGKCPRLGVFSRRLLQLENIDVFSGTDSLIFRPRPKQAADFDAIIGWGHKPTSLIARRFAKDHGLPYWAIEDGFIRSVDLGSSTPPLSLVVDERGIYYDSSGPSALEDLLASSGATDALSDSNLLARSRRCREQIVQSGLSKYNYSTDEVPAKLLQAKHPIVLVVDQTWGDASVELGQGGPPLFLEMLSAACSENPDATIILKTHPDTIAGKKKGYFTRGALPSRVRMLTSAVSPHSVLACAGSDLRLHVSAWIRCLAARQTGHLFWRAVLCGLGIDRRSMRVQSKDSKTYSG